MPLPRAEENRESICRHVTFSGSVLTIPTLKQFCKAIRDCTILNNTIIENRQYFIS